MRKRYLRQSTTQTWKMASYEPVVRKPETPPPSPEPERWDKRVWAALRRF